MQKLLTNLKLSIAGLALGLAFTAAASASTSVSYYGITWTFSSDRPTGTFVNGEPWVIGPVTITNINPNPTQAVHGVQHGSMINPVPGQNYGFDNHPNVSREAVYEAAKNVALSFPFNLKVNDVLVSANSQYEYPTFLRTVCALTVVGSAPPEGSFRPSIFGSDRTIKWNANQINWGVLKNYAAVPSTPSKATILAQVPPLPWFEWAQIWSGNGLQPRDNTADGNKQYGRETAQKFGQVGLWLNTNQPLADKREIGIQIIQNGIDIYYYVKNGGGFYHDGGHKCGRKLPAVMAAMMLNDAELKNFCANPDIFQEDTQTFFVKQSDVGRVMIPGNETYLQSDVGIGEWGIRHRWEPDQDSRSLNALYRMVVGPGMMPAWVAGYLMGAQSVWNHPPAFAYMDRYNSLFGAGTTFAQEMYNTHRSGGGIIIPPPESVATPVISPAGGTFETSQTVTMTCATSGATIRYTTNGATPTATDTIYSSPLTISTTTTVKAIAFKTGVSASGMATSLFTVATSPPTFSPSPGNYTDPVTVTLSTPSTGATIRYTNDGSEPSALSPIYTGPITITSTTTIKALAFKSGIAASPVSSGIYAIGAFVSTQEFTTVPFVVPKTTLFTYGFEMTPSAENIDAVVGLGGVNPVTEFNDLACSVRFSAGGKLEARNGSTYGAGMDLPYTSGKTYGVRMIVNPATKTYTVTISINGGTAVILARDFAFRTEQATLTTFNSMALVSVIGSHTVSNFGLVPERPKGLKKIGGS